MVLVHLGCALKETRMEIEDITWVSLTTGRSSQKKRHLTVSDSLLGEIVIDDEGVLGIITEELTNGASGIGGQELEGSGIRSSGSDDDGVLHAVSLVKESNDVGNSGSLLSDSDVDTVKGLGVVTDLKDGFLVDDGIDSDSGFADLSITNDKLTLASSNGHLIK